MSEDALATEAVAEVRSGMIVGLGTGRAAARAIDALALRAARQGLDLRCVATSRASEEQATRLGLRVVPMEGVERVDYLFDGADEMDEALRMVKGRGGAMTREKIVAHAASRRVYLVQQSKIVRRLGRSAPLPVEVMRFGLAAIRRALAELGLVGPVRLRQGTSVEYETDNGNPVIDAALAPDAELERIGAALDALPGVVGHGLFLREADEALVEDESGRVVRLPRPAPPRSA